MSVIALEFAGSWTNGEDADRCGGGGFSHRFKHWIFWHVEELSFFLSQIFFSPPVCFWLLLF